MDLINNKSIFSCSLFVSALLLLLCVFPNICFADAIYPIVNIFIPEHSFLSSILIILIILIEAILLWKWIKPLSFHLSLWRSVVMNLASSAIGSVVVLLFLQEKLELVDMWSLVIPMFILTLVVETPLLKILYRNLDDGLTWIRTVRISFGINFISYLFLIIFPFIFLLAYSVYGNIADKENIEKWNDISLLNNESGYIYTLENAYTGKYRENVLKQYDVKMRKWETIAPATEWKRGINYLAWDIRGNILACIIKTGGSENRPLSIFDIPSYSPIIQLMGDFIEVRISPDLEKIAVLEYVRKAVAPKDAESYFWLGSICRLKVYEINTGNQLCIVPDFALDKGFCWTNNSKKILFTSLRDKDLYSYQEDGLPPKGLGLGYAKKGQFPIDIYSYDLATNSTKTISEGVEPRIVSSTGDITFLRLKEDFRYEMWNLNFITGKSIMLAGDVCSNHYAVSPSGTKLLVKVPQHKVLGKDFFLTVIDSNKDSKRRFILRPTSSYDFRWVQKSPE